LAKEDGNEELQASAIEEIGLQQRKQLRVMIHVSTGAFLAALDQGLEVRASLLQELVDCLCHSLHASAVQARKGKWKVC
jgi:hypothetical protein